jgi:hypothetical protein
MVPATGFEPAHHVGTESESAAYTKFRHVGKRLEWACSDALFLDR